MEELLASADDASRAGRHDEAAAALERAASTLEYPDEVLCSRLAATWARAGDPEAAGRWAVRTVDAGRTFTRWRAASRVLDEVLPGGAPAERRRMRVAVLGTSTITTLLPCLRLALARIGIGVELYEAPYGQYWQEALDPSSGLRSFDPDVVVLVPDHHALGREVEAADAGAWLAQETARWTGPWEAIRSWSAADVVQLGIAEPAGDPFGDAAATLAGSPRQRVRALNAALADAVAAAGGAFVDTEAIAADLGKRVWFDNRFWYAAKHAFSMAAAPTLALHVAGVVAGRAGLSKKVVVVDLDNTLWHGVIGDDGLDGIELTGPRGEAHVAFQQALADLTERGVVLAACSKNDELVARLPFDQHPDMVLSVDHFAAFVANWEPKPRNLERISQHLSLGLDSMLYVDDNPAEREAIRRALPGVDVLRLAPDESDWCDDLARYPWLQPAGLTEEDRQRAASYRARAAAQDLRTSGESLEDFQRSLEMTATLAPVDDLTFDRVVQLINKTNQFNLTTHRHGADAVRRMVEDPAWVHVTGRLEDRFADHGLVAVVLARDTGEVLDVDTFVMSCRVIGRSLETVLIEELVSAASQRGRPAVRARYVPTDRNGLVEDLWTRHGFRHIATDDDGTAHHELALDDHTPAAPPITIVRNP